MALLATCGRIRDLLKEEPMGTLALLTNKEWGCLQAWKGSSTIRFKEPCGSEAKTAWQHCHQGLKDHLYKQNPDVRFTGVRNQVADNICSEWLRRYPSWVSSGVRTATYAVDVKSSDELLGPFEGLIVYAINGDVTATETVRRGDYRVDIRSDLHFKVLFVDKRRLQLLNDELDTKPYDKVVEYVRTEWKPKPVLMDSLPGWGNM